MGGDRRYRNGSHGGDGSRDLILIGSLRLHVHRPYPDTPFNEDLPVSVFSEPGVMRVDDPYAADWVVSGRLRPILPIVLTKRRGRFLIWTNEPRHSRTTRASVSVPALGARIEFMNVFGGDVFWHNLHFLGGFHANVWADIGIGIQQKLPRLSTIASGRERKCVAVFSYRLDSRTSWVISGNDVDLVRTRSQCALAGHERDLCDVYGRGWPGRMAREDSWHCHGWAGRKLDILRRYRFSIALENTNWPHYCTEKIWHAIVGGTLPIYWGKGNRIYDTFPQDSFMDLADYSDYGSLYDHINVMSDAEYIERFNRCVDAYNRSASVRRATIYEEPNEHIRRILPRLRSRRPSE